MLIDHVKTAYFCGVGYRRHYEIKKQNKTKNNKYIIATTISQ